MRIKVLGIQRTATNYLGYLVSDNIKQDTGYIVKDQGWKHGCVTRFNDVDKELRAQRDDKAIVVIKNPYTWYTSILNYLDNSYGKRTKYEQFGGLTPEKLFARYNLIYENHKRFLLGEYDDTVFTDSFFIRYEDLLIDFEKELERTADKFNTVLNEPLKNTVHVKMSSKFTEARRSYYIAQKPRYNEETIRKVTSVVDWDLMGFYGYTKIGG
jgi:hypothetical protein